MKTKYLSALIGFSATVAIAVFIHSCAGGKKAPEKESVEQITTNADASGLVITLTFKKGSSFNHPLLAIWLEDTNNRYIETLYVSESIGKGIFQHGDKTGGEWQPGPVRRPAALPYWGHQRGVQAPDGFYLPTPENPVADAITGPTPQGNFILQSKSSGNLSGPFKVMLEINQSWDWNDFWTNNKFPEEEHYKTSSQPAVVYECTIDPGNLLQENEMKPVGHSHYSGKDGNLYPDLETLTTALEIAEKITVRVSPVKN